MTSQVLNSTGIYNHLCYPDFRKKMFEKELSKETLFLALAIALYVLVILITISVTFALAPTTLHIVLGGLGLTAIPALGFIFSPCNLKIQKLKEQIALEEKVICKMKGEKNQKSHQAALLVREKIAIEYINTQQKNENLSAKLEVMKKQLEVKFYQFLKNNPKEKLSFEQAITQHYSTYNENDRQKMLLSNPSFPVFTNKFDGKKIFWKDFIVS